MVRETREEEDHLLGLPLALPTRHQAQGLFVLAESRFNHRPTVVGIGQGYRLVVDQRGHQYRVLIPALLLRGADHPLPGGPTEAVGADVSRDLPARARRRLPGPKRLA